MNSHTPLVFVSFVLLIIVIGLFHFVLVKCDGFKWRSVHSSFIFFLFFIIFIIIIIIISRVALLQWSLLHLLHLLDAAAHLTLVDRPSSVHGVVQMSW